MQEIRDKITARGVESLTEGELLSLILDEDGDGAQLAQSLLEECGEGSIFHMTHRDLPRLRMLNGLGLRRALRLIAASEWGRRSVVAESSKQLQIKSSADVSAMFRPRLEHLQHEECWTLYLNSANGVVEQQRVSQGGVTATVVDHRLIIKRALELLATKIVLIHNHPSGSVEPSADDIRLTSRVKSAAELFDITLIDHIIIGSEGDCSLKGRGLL